MTGYLGLARAGKLRERVERVRDLAAGCRLCPRNCAVDRFGGETGWCGVTDLAAVADWGPHFGEELPLSGWRGSGTIFFSSCNMRCVFCQNPEVSRNVGRELSPEELADLMLELQSLGCHNVNLVSPTPHVPAILQGLELATERGLMLPVVYNSGGYDSVELLQCLDGIVDIYMPDLKYSDDAAAAQLSGVDRYVECSQAAVAEMYRQVGDLRVDDQGIAFRGLLIRHLVLPGDRAGTAGVLRFIAEEISRGTHVSLMRQYRPVGSDLPAEIRRRLTSREFAGACAAAKAAGLTNVQC